MKWCRSVLSWFFPRKIVNMKATCMGFASYSLLFVLKKALELTFLQGKNYLHHFQVKPTNFSILFPKNRTANLLRQLCCIRNVFTHFQNVLLHLSTKQEAFFVDWFSFWGKLLSNLSFFKSARRSRIFFGSLLLFLLQASYLGKKCTSAHFQDSPTYWVWKFFFLLGGTKYNINFSYLRWFLKFARFGLIFPDGGSTHVNVLVGTHWL